MTLLTKICFRVKPSRTPQISKIIYFRVYININKNKLNNLNKLTNFEIWEQEGLQSVADSQILNHQASFSDSMWLTDWWRSQRWWTCRDRTFWTCCEWWEDAGSCCIEFIMIGAQLFKQLIHQKSGNAGDNRNGSHFDSLTRGNRKVEERNIYNSAG